MAKLQLAALPHCAHTLALDDHQHLHALKLHVRYSYLSERQHTAMLWVVCHIGHKLSTRLSQGLHIHLITLGKCRRGASRGNTRPVNYATEAYYAAVYLSRTLALAYWLLVQIVLKI